MSSEEPQLHPTPKKRGPEVLSEAELFWKKQYDWLLKAGYRLRSRYSPGWTPSWVQHNRSPQSAEDAQVSYHASINHAISLKTGHFVVLKEVNIMKYPREVEITDYLTEESRGADQRNHSVQALEILQHPEDVNTRIIVLPLLRDFDDPPFDTVGEALDFISQLFEAIQFLHENGVAHGDVSINNIMLDANEMYPQGFHPCEPDLKADFSGRAVPKFTRTEKPPKYYVIDFGISQRFEEGEEPISVDRMGTDLTVPEYHDRSQTINPFLVDVYCVGNMIKYDFLDGDPNRKTRPGYFGFEFLRPLIDDMIQSDPKSRPTMDQVISRFDELVRSLSSSSLKARCRKKPMYEGDKDPLPIVAALALHHWYKQFTYAVRRLPPVPKRT